jgi:hypothetical protein
MPSKTRCDKIQDPKEREDCKKYRGKYAKGNRKSSMINKRGIDIKY